MKLSLLLLHFFLLPIILLAQVEDISDENCSEQADRLVVVGSIILEGNDVTRDKIVYREMEFATGDTLPYKELCRLSKLSKENLLNRSLFNFVYIDLIDNQVTDVVDLK
ncbi:MAG: hypothetical protein KJ754_13160, partial [Bacteroidetes bacterium]|nr:hypothetical protein [Bacteroidota bacterium]MBU1580375.1 hypothetical protein [Bacteroidota bacterium]